MAATFVNNAASLLAQSLLANATTLQVRAGEGVRFPAPNSPNYFVVTVQAGGVYEIMRCTARVGDTLTVQRAQEGTTAQLFAAGAAVDARITAGALDSITQDAAAAQAAATAATATANVAATTAAMAAASAASAASAAALAAPIGVLLPWLGNAAPAGYALCHGQAINRATNPQLWAIMGTTYGAGDGSTTFNLPDMRAAVPVGADAMGGDARNQIPSATRGARIGEATVELVAGNLPAHTHTGTTASAGDHGHTVTVDANGAHTHGIVGGFVVGGGTGVGGTGTGQLGGAINADGVHVHSATANTAGAHTHTFTTSSVGSNAAHNNIQPSVIVHYVVRLG